MKTRNKYPRLLLTLAMAGCVTLGATMPTQAARAPRGERPQMSEGDFQAKQMVTRGTELLEMGESERGVKMLETVVQQFPQSAIRFEAYLKLGKHYLDVHEQLKAVNYLRSVRDLLTDRTAEELSDEEREMYLESMYLMGVSYFQVRQYGSAFPVLRKITEDFPNSVWANQAYYYIGMCHFSQSNWNKAISALNLVGTFVDPKSPTVEYVEAGRRFYVKIEDVDLPVLYRLGRKVKVTIKTRNGDSETIECVPLPGTEEIFVGSIPTALGAAKVGDATLQVLGGDEITTHYVDSNTQSGENNVKRDSKVKVVSTATVAFTLGDYETRTNTVALGQPIAVLLHDADLDTSDAADEVEVRVISRYRQDPDDVQAVTSSSSGIGVDINRLFSTEQEQFIVRDEVVVKLSELGKSPVRTGRFGGLVQVEPLRPGQSFERNDAILTCAINDEVVATFVDTIHVGGESSREAQASLRVVNEIESVPRVTQAVVSDPVVAAKKNLVEAEAYLELGRIFKSMGLAKGAAEKAQEGLDRVESIIRTTASLPSDLTERAFILKWEMHLVQNDYKSAIATCKIFNQLFPQSPFVDQALLGVANIKLENKEYAEANTILQQIISLPNSAVKAQAQFMIAQSIEQSDPIAKEKGYSERAIAAYKTCAQRYPDSEYAGESLAKLADYYIQTQDYSQANDLLDQVFTDYPDAKFLDSMLLKAVMVSYRMGDFQKAYDKCSQLIFEYPDSAYAEKAKQVLPKIEQQISK